MMFYDSWLGVFFLQSVSELVASICRHVVCHCESSSTTPSPLASAKLVQFSSVQLLVGEVGLMVLTFVDIHFFIKTRGT